MSETFYNYRGYRYFWRNLFLVGIAILAYWVYRPIGGRNGGTVVGYALGGIAALGIFYLMWYGMRKRSYYSANTSLKGCLSAHIWLGLALVILVPLHCGFSFGCNVHTLAYVLMLVVIISGIWGALAYVDLAPQIKSHRGGGTVKKLLEQIHLVSADISTLARDKSDQFLSLLNKLDTQADFHLRKLLFSSAPAILNQQEIAAAITAISEKEQSQAMKLVGMLNKKRELLANLIHEVQVQAKLKLWLYLHLPLSFALLVTLLIHIYSVFWYW